MKRYNAKTNNQVQSNPSITKREAKISLASRNIISLIETNDIAWQLLQYAAWLKADNMPTEVLLHAMDKNHSGVKAGIQTLEKLSLFTPVDIEGDRGIAMDSSVQDLCFKYMSKYLNKSMKPDILVLSLFQIYNKLLPEVEVPLYEFGSIIWSRNYAQEWKQNRYLLQVEALFEFINARSVKVNIDRVMLKLRSRVASIHAYALNPTLRDLTKSLNHSYEALKLFESSYPNRKESDLICILNNVGTAYKALGALQYHKQYNICGVKVYGTQLYDFARGSYKASDDCYFSHDYKRAIRAYKRALKLYEELYSKNYPSSDIIRSLIKSSKAIRSSGNYKEAVTHARQAAKICEAINGKTSSEFAEALYNLGSVHGYYCNFDISTECKEEALDIYGKLYKHSDFLALNKQINRQVDKQIIMNLTR